MKIPVKSLKYFRGSISESLKDRKRDNTDHKNKSSQ